MSKLPLSRRALMAWAILPFLSSVASAQTYPDKPITLVVPVAAGGLTDQLGRALATRLGQRLGQSVIVDNRSGASGAIGMAHGARATADGYTLTMGYSGAATVNTVLQKNLPYDTPRDFAPVSMIGYLQMALLVRPTLEARNVDELIKLARQQPLSYGSAGNATSHHIAMEMLKLAAKVPMVHVPYRGEAAALTELMGGRIDTALVSMSSALPLARAGKARMIAIATDKRSRLVPDVPTLIESGFPGLTTSGWYAVLAPAGTPSDIVLRLSREVQAIVRDPAFIADMDARGVELEGSTPEALKKKIDDDLVHWRRVFAETGIKVD